VTETIDNTDKQAQTSTESAKLVVREESAEEAKESGSTAALSARKPEKMKD
jgi:hypothetical protein